MPVFAPLLEKLALVMKSPGSALGRTGIAVVLGGVGLILTLSSNLAHAAAPAKSAAMQRVGAACQEEAMRFCSWADPALADTAGADTAGADPDAIGASRIDPRDVFICLRVYSSNVSPSCRKAINDAKQ